MAGAWRVYRRQYQFSPELFAAPPPLEVLVSVTTYPSARRPEQFRLRMDRRALETSVAFEAGKPRSRSSTRSAPPTRVGCATSPIGRHSCVARVPRAIPGRHEDRLAVRSVDTRAASIEKS